MMQQQTPQVPAGLQALFVLQDPKVQQALNVLKQQAAPAAQGPQGQLTPTVSGQVLQSFSPPQPQMPPGIPPGMPPQGPDMADIAQNTVTGANITGMQQQQAQEALMKQLMAQQQAKAQQPVMAAEGGIASLDIAGMEDYAEGGVVGYNGTETSEVNLGGVSGIPYYAPGPSEERERLNRLPVEALEQILELIRRGGSALVKGTTLDPEYNKPKAEAAPEETPQPMVPMIPNKGLEEPTGGQAPREERRAPPAPRMDSGIAAPRQAAARQASAPATIPGEDLYQQALALADKYKGSDGRTAAQIERDRLAEYQRRGLPDLRRAAEERMRQVGEFDAETRRQFVEGNKAAMQNAWASGILQPGARNLAELFGGAARSMIGEEGRQSAAAAALRAGERAQMILDNQIREALDKADKAAADGDITTAQAEKAKAQEFANKKLDVQREMIMNRAKDVLGYQQVMDAEKLRQAGAERIASRNSEFERLYNRVFPNQPMTLENMEKLKRALSPALEDKEVARQAALSLKKKELMEKNMNYKLLTIKLQSAKTQEEIDTIQNQMSAIERSYGIGNIDTGAGQRKVIDFSSIGAQ